MTPDDFTVRFDSALVEQAQALGAAHASANGYEHLIVGQEVADQLAGDYIAACLKVQRENARRAKTASDGDTSSTARDDAPGEPIDEAAAKEAARAQRAEEKAAREAAAVRNEELGLALVRHLSKVRVDDRVLKVLTAADIGSQLGKIASRGARYGFPGWVQQEERKAGGVKREYLAPTEAQAKAVEYLAGGRTTTEIAGRTLALVAMARYADESAVAQSQRSFFSLRFTTYGGGNLPWSGEAEELLDELVIEKLPDAITEPIRVARTERAARRADEERRARERDEAVAAFVEQAPAMACEARQAEIQRLRSEYGFNAIPHGAGEQLMKLPEPDGTAEPADAS